MYKKRVFLKNEEKNTQRMNKILYAAASRVTKVTKVTIVTTVTIVTC